MKVEGAESDRLFPVTRRLIAEARTLDVDLTRGTAIEGLLEHREGVCLYMLARWGGQSGAVVEIGSWKGRSTWYLARGLADSGSAHGVVAIDPHLEGTRDAFLRTLEETGVGDRVEPRFAAAEDVRDVPGPIGLLWIDGDHGYRAVARDFDQWFPLLETGGWLAFHDTVNRWYGPTRLVRRLLVTRTDLRSVGVIGTITFARKAPPSALNRLRCIASRLALELVTAIWSLRTGRGPTERMPDER
jgi:predicted O-methyltransferase YrrM